MCYFKFTAKFLVIPPPRIPRLPSPVKNSTADPAARSAVEGEEIPATVQFSAKPETERRREFLSWWGKVDSNHRSRRQQIYSLPHLTALEFPHMKFLELVDGLEPPAC